MTYIIVKERQTVVGRPFSSYNAAIGEANRLFGDDPVAWISANVRVEENRS